MPRAESAARARERRRPRTARSRSMRINIAFPMRWALVLLTCWVCSAVRAQEAPEWFVESFLDIREESAEAAKEGKRLLLYFMQDGCPYCRQLVTVNWRQPHIVEKTRRHFVPVAINLWGDGEV